VPSPPAAALAGDALARVLITKTLEQYRAAYANKDYAAIKQVYPTAPATFAQQFGQYSSIDYSFTGPLNFINLDVRGGAAIVEVPTRFIATRTVGGADKREGITRFSLLKRGADDEWVIVNTLVK
jgi:hypothetical protein